MKTSKSLTVSHKSALSFLFTILLHGFVPGTPVTSASASPPPMIAYQGRVTANGVAFTGIGRFKFALVSATGGGTFWSHDGTSVAGSEPTNSLSLPVTNGLYSVRLGDTTVAGMVAPLSSTVFVNNTDARLRVWFNDGTHGSQLLSPDQRLASVAYALTAEKLTGQITATNISPGSITSVSLANKTITGAKLADATITPTQFDPAIGVWKKSGTAVSYNQGFVSIGNASPSAPLHITGSGPYGSGLILGGSPTINGTTTLEMGVTAVTGGDAFIDTISLAGVAYGNLLLTRYGGGIGIGMGDRPPTAPLHVASRTGWVNTILESQSQEGVWLTLANNSPGGTNWVINSNGSADHGGRRGSLVFGSSPFRGVLNDPLLVLDPAGRVGIANPAPVAPLHVTGAAAGGRLMVLRGNPTTSGITTLEFGLTAPANGDPYIQGVGSANHSYGRLRINGAGGDVQMGSDKPVLISASGKVGIGTTNPSAPLHIKGTNTQSILIGDPTSNQTTLMALGLTKEANGYPYIQGVTSSGVSYGTMKINPDGGDLQVGSGSAHLNVNETSTFATFAVRKNSGDMYGARFARVDGTGQVGISTGDYALEVWGEAYKNNGSPFWNTTSDRRLKTGIRPIEAALETVERVRPVQYHYNAEHRAKNPGTPDVEQYGVVAQEFAEVFPEFVTTGSDGYLSVNSSPLVFVNTAAVQELHRELKERDAKIHAIQMQNEQLQQRLSRVETIRSQFDAILARLATLEGKPAADVAR